MRVMVINATFNNISVISWQSVLSVDETGVPGGNHRPVASQWQTLSHVELATDGSDSCLDLHLNIDSEGRLRPKLYDKRDDCNFPIVNFPFICSNIPVAPAYGVYISQLIRYSRACGSYLDFLDKGLLLTRKLLNQGFLLVKLKSSLRKYYAHGHEYVPLVVSTTRSFPHSWFITGFITR